MDLIVWMSVVVVIVSASALAKGKLHSPHKELTIDARRIGRVKQCTGLRILEPEPHVEIQRNID